MKTKIAAALESLAAYGEGKAADAGTFDGNDVFPAFGVNFEQDGDTVQRQIQTGDISKKPHISVLKRAMVTFKTELMGPGVTKLSAGQASKLGILFRGAGFSESLKLDYDGGTGDFLATETLSQVAVVDGTVDISSGFDWGTTNQDFSINVNGTGATTVTLDTACVSQATVVTEINDAFTAAGVTGVEAYAVGTLYVGIRTTANHVGGFVLAAGTTDALATLGIAAGTYIGATATVSAVSGTTVSGTLTLTGFSGKITNDVPITSDVAGAAVANGTLFYSYKPETDNLESLHIKVEEEGVLSSLVGAVGTVKTTLSVGNFGVLEWQFWGLYAEPANGTLDAETDLDVATPEEIKNISFSLGGYEKFITETLDIDIGNTVARIDSINAPSAVLGLDGIVQYIITERNATGSFEPQRVRPTSDADAFNFINYWANATSMSMSLTVGSTTGNKITMTAPYVQFEKPSNTEKDGIRKYSIPLSFARSSGNDEFVIEFR